jgi:hypothetical protein
MFNIMLSTLKDKLSVGAHTHALQPCSLDPQSGMIIQNPQKIPHLCKEQGIVTVKVPFNWNDIAMSVPLDDLT